MMTKLIIEGMHCAACKALITMELEDNSLEDKIESLELAANNQGYLRLKEVTDGQIEEIKKIIDSLAQYQVININKE